MQLISKYNKGIKYLLCVTDLFSKYAWVVPLRDKKGVTIVNAFQSILKYGLIKLVNFKIILLKKGYKKIT